MFQGLKKSLVAVVQGSADDCKDYVKPWNCTTCPSDKYDGSE